MIYLNNRKVEFEKFPNNEVGLDIHKLIFGNINYITLKWENDNDIIKLMFLKEYLDKFNTINNLTIAYMPYSRMDREEGKFAFTLKYVTNFINYLCFDSIEVIEPHSDVTLALLDNCSATYPTIEYLPQIFMDIGFDDTKDYLFFPDAGAQKRYKNIKANSLVGYKQRDFNTGKIKKLDIVGDMEKGRKVLILDDLCSFGGTFHLSAQKLKVLGTSEIYLFITHCEYNIFKGELLKQGSPIDKVFTTNTIIENDHVGHSRLEVMEVIKVYD